MKSNSVPIQELLLKQIISEAGIVKTEHKEGLKMCFQKKFASHVNTIQYNQLREDRFILSQKKILQKQNYSIQKAKEYIALRQDRALSNKNHSMLEKSKRVEEELSKWKRVVEKNKKQHQQSIQQSMKVIRKWNDKLSESSSRKSMRMNHVAEALKRKSQQKSQLAYNSRSRQAQLAPKKSLNPETHEDLSPRYNKSRESQRIKNRNSRISTENLYERRSKREEDMLQKSLIKTGQKQERINEARFMKHYLQQRKKKIKHQKQEAQRKVREFHLSQLHDDIEARNSALDKKHRSENKKTPMRRGSLPQVSGKAASILLLNGEAKERSIQHLQSKNKQRNSQQKPLDKATSRTLQPNYDKLVTEKIHHIAHYIRNYKKFG